MRAVPRVLYVVGANGTGGTELQARALIQAIRRRGVPALVVLLDGSHGLEGLPSDTQVIADERPGLFRGIVTYTKAACRVRRLLRSGEFDVVHGIHARGYTIAGLAAAGLSDVRRVAWRRNLGVHLRGRKAVLGALLERVTLRVADVVLVNSADVRDYWIDRGRVSESRVVVVPNLLHDWRFNVERVPAVNPRKIVAVGGLRSVKGHDVLLRAVSGLGREDVEVVILGDGERRAELVSLAKELGVRLVLPGVQADPRPWLGAATLFAHPSLSEGASNAVIEAMAAGAPVVASDVGGMRELLGDAGVIVPPGDVACLRGAIAHLLESESVRARLGAAARMRAKERFSEEKVVDLTLSVYRGDLACVAS